MFSCSLENKERIMLANFVSLLNLILKKRRTVNLIHNIAVPEGLTVYFCIRLRKQNEKNENERNKNT